MVEFDDRDVTATLGATLGAELAGSSSAPSPKRFKGKPCRNGHDGWRYVSNGECCDCVAARTLPWERRKGSRRRTS